MWRLPGGRWLLLVGVLGFAVAAAAQGTRPQIRVLAPRDATEVAGPNIEIRMQVRGVDLAARRSGPGAYILLSLDDGPPMKSYTDRFTFQGVDAGDHILRAELRRTDDTGFNPPVRAQVRFSVRVPRP